MRIVQFRIENFRNIRLVSVLADLLLDDIHLKPFTKALLDSRLAKLAKQAWDAVFKGTSGQTAGAPTPEFSVVEAEAKQLLQQSVQDDTWRKRCKGRDLISAFCSKHGFNTNTSGTC